MLISIILIVCQRVTQEIFPNDSMAYFELIENNSIDLYSDDFGHDLIPMDAGKRWIL